MCKIYNFNALPVCYLLYTKPNILSIFPLEEQGLGMVHTLPYCKIVKISCFRREPWLVNVCYLLYSYIIILPFNICRWILVLPQALFSLLKIFVLVCRWILVIHQGLFSLLEIFLLVCIAVLNIICSKFFM